MWEKSNQLSSVRQPRCPGQISEDGAHPGQPEEWLLEAHQPHTARNLRGWKLSVLVTPQPLFWDKQIQSKGGILGRRRKKS